MAPNTHQLHLQFTPRAVHTLLMSCAALALGACGSGAAPAAQESQPAQSGALAPATSYVLHEWGFFAASLDEEGVSAASGPRGLSSVPPPSMALEHTERFSVGGLGAHGVGAGGKPVLYFHLDEGVADLALSVGIRPAGSAQLVEHFPPGELSAEGRSLRWPNVRITRGACRGSYPALTDPACQISDGLCEQSELAGYESAGADCVNVGEQHTGVLFYRTGPAAASLPLAVSRQGEDVVRLAHVDAAGPSRVRGWAMRIARGADRTQSRVRVISLDGSDPVDVPPATGDGSVGAAAAIAQLRAAVLAGGLDEPEANAFMAAWSDALFGAEPPPAPPVPPPGTIGMGQSAYPRPHPLASVADAIIYVVPQDSVDALLPLALSPEPRRIQRVFLARVTLSREALRVRLDPPTVQGGLPLDVARRVLRRHLNGLRRCVASNVELGRVTVNMRVLPTGVVERVTFEGLDIGDESRGCLQSYVQRIEFPTADAPTSVSLPILISR